MKAIPRLPRCSRPCVRSRRVIISRRNGFRRTTILVRRGGGDYKRRIPHILTNGFIIVSEKSAEALRRFDLGEGALYPTRLYYPDKKTRLGGDYFYLSHGNKKNAFLPEESPEAKHVDRKYGFWGLPPNPVDNQLVFSQAALDGPDVWWDERIVFCFFISDRLARALKATGVAKDWGLLRCPVVVSG